MHKTKRSKNLQPEQNHSKRKRDINFNFDEGMFRDTELWKEEDTLTIFWKGMFRDKLLQKAAVYGKRR